MPYTRRRRAPVRKTRKVTTVNIIIKKKIYRKDTIACRDLSPRWRTSFDAEITIRHHSSLIQLWRRL